MSPSAEQIRPNMDRIRDRRSSPVRTGSGSSPMSISALREQSSATPPRQQHDRRPALMSGHSASAVKKTSGTPSRDIPACDRCRTFKKKCSRTFPTCRLCANAGQKCSFSTPVTSGAAEIHHLRARLDWLTKHINDGLPVGTCRLESVDTGADLNRIFSVAAASSSSRQFSSGLFAPAIGSTASSESINSKDAFRDQAAPGSVLFDQPHAVSNSNGNPIPIDGQTSVVTTSSASQGLPLANTNPGQASGSGSSTLSKDAAARRFVDAYFRHVNRAYPFVDRNKILRCLDTTSEMPPSRNTDAESTILYLVMAIGCTTLQRAGHIPGDTASRFDVAYSDITQECIARNDIESIQILVLLSLYSLFDPNGMSTWLIVGIISRKALRLGLSRKVSEDKILSVTDIELQRRLLWSVYVLDRMMAVSLGLPVALVDENMDISLPGLTVEEFTSSEKPYFTSILQTNRHVIRLRQIEDRILKEVHLRKHSEIAALSASDRRAVLQDIRSTIEDWYSHGCLVSPLEPDNVPIHNSITWQSARYYHLLILLYYPCHFNSFGPVPANELLRFAQKHLQSTSVLLQQRQLPLNQVTLCRLFPVGLVLLHSCLSTARNGVQEPARDEVAIVIAILESFPEAWSKAHELAQLFRQFMAIVSGVSSESPLQFSGPVYGNFALEMSKDLYQAMMRPVLTGLVTVMQDVLGKATCFAGIDLQDGPDGVDASVSESGYQTSTLPSQRDTATTVPFTALPASDGNAMNYDWGSVELGFI